MMIKLVERKGGVFRIKENFGFTGPGNTCIGPMKNMREAQIKHNRLLNQQINNPWKGYQHGRKNFKIIDNID